MISVIICTYNRAHLLKRLLQSLERQTMPSDQFEILVVDDGSEDNTCDVCHSMQTILPNLRYIFAGRNLGLASAANLGRKDAYGEYLLFTDDDCVAREDWVEKMNAVLHEHPIVAGAVDSPAKPYVKLCHHIAEFHRFMPGRKAGFVEFIAGSSMGFRRSVLEDLGGFKDGIRLAPDMECILRARLNGYQIYFEPQAVVLHDPERFNFIWLWQYSAKHASQTILLRQQYHSLMRTPFVLRSPLLTLLCAPFIALRVTVGIYFHHRSAVKYFHTAPLVYMLKIAWCWGAARGLLNWKRSLSEEERKIL